MITLNGVTVSPTIFPDGTSQVWKLKDLVDVHMNRVEWYFEQEAELIHIQQLKQLIDVTQSHPLKTVNLLHIPYLPYARQDKNVSDHQTFAFHSFAQILNSQGWDIITAFDPHSNLPIEIVPNFKALYPEFRDIVNEYDVVVFPDQGANLRYARRVCFKPITVGNKTRDQSTGHITSFQINSGQVTGKKVIVIDDLCDGGATFNVLAGELSSADYVDLYVSHGLFSKGLDNLLLYYNKIITTDTRFAHVLSNPASWDAAAQQSVLWKSMFRAFSAGKLEIIPHKRKPTS